MTPWARVIAIAAVGAVLGAIALSLLTLLFYVIFARDALKDGQFALVFMATIPFGAMLGAVAGATLSLLALAKTESAGWVCLVGGGIVAGLAALFTRFWAISEGRGVKDVILGLVHPGWGAPFIGALAEMMWGASLLRRR
jgi:hypothetical protein